MATRTASILLALLLAATSATAATPDGPFDDWISKAEHGDVYFQQQLAAIYASPGSSHYDPDQAEYWHLKMAEGGDANAQANVGYFYATGPKPDPAKALEWLNKAAAQNEPGAVSTLCVAYYKGQFWLPADFTPDMTQAAAYCAQGAGLADLPSMRIIAEMTGRGLGGIPQDGAKAVDLLAAVFASSHAPADQLVLAHAWYDGVYVPADYQKSFPLFKSVFRRLPAASASYLAEHYALGHGTTREAAEAARLYLWASTQGDACAAAWLATHPTVTPDSVAANRITNKGLPPGKYVWQAPDGAGGFVPVNVAPQITQSIADFYPERAQSDEVEGYATVECHISLDGDFDNCLAVDESPPGYGFLKSSQRVTAYIKTPDFTNKDRYAATYGGKAYSFRLAWKLG